jgi:hypothetical protein
MVMNEQLESGCIEEQDYRRQDFDCEVMLPAPLRLSEYYIDLDEVETSN